MCFMFWTVPRLNEIPMIDMVKYHIQFQILNICKEEIYYHTISRFVPNRNEFIVIFNQSLLTEIPFMTFISFFSKNLFI